MAAPTLAPTMLAQAAKRDGGRGKRARDDVVLDRIDADAAQRSIRRRRPAMPPSAERADQHELRPAEAERPLAAPAFADVGVEAAGLRQRGGELGQRRARRTA